MEDGFPVRLQLHRSLVRLWSMMSALWVLGLQDCLLLSSSSRYHAAHGVQLHNICRSQQSVSFHTGNLWIKSLCTQKCQETDKDISVCVVEKGAEVGEPCQKCAMWYCSKVMGSL